MMQWRINGVVDASLNADDRGFAYGDGLFETIAVRDGACRLFAAHLQRLSASALRLGMPVPDPDYLKSECQAAIGSAQKGTLKIIYTRGAGPRGYASPARVAPLLAVGFSAVCPAAVLLDGIAVRLCATRVAVSPALAGMKTLNRLEQVLARSEWTTDEFAEGLMFAPDEHLICGTMSNVFLVTATGLQTPRLDQSGVSGVMRQRLMELATQQAFDVCERAITRAELFTADDVFLTNSQVGMLPVARIEHHRYQRSPVTVRLRAALAAAGIAECAA
jgi:4-amino-4-deoxychorismate lyase